MRVLLQNLFGVYTPVIIDNLDGTTTCQVDYEYILGVLGFFLVLYCVFRLFGVILSGGKK